MSAKCQECGSKRIANINAKAVRCNVTVKGYTYSGEIPDDMNIGGGDIIDFDLCLGCGTIVADFPLDETAVEIEAADEAEDEDE